jgi:hypothetical protein
LFVNRTGKPLNRDKFRETVIRPALTAAGLPPNTRTYDTLCVNLYPEESSTVRFFPSVVR